jgi:hypothetical protein
MARSTGHLQKSVLKQVLLLLCCPTECSPGYYLESASCSPCGKGGYCTGADATRQSCGTHLTTKAATASEAAACITLPGVAYNTGPATAAPCPLYSYNAGGNHRNCTGKGASNRRCRFASYCSVCGPASGEPAVRNLLVQQHCAGCARQLAVNRKSQSPS